MYIYRHQPVPAISLFLYSCHRVYPRVFLFCFRVPVSPRRFILPVVGVYRSNGPTQVSYRTCAFIFIYEGIPCFRCQWQSILSFSSIIGFAGRFIGSFRWRATCSPPALQFLWIARAAFRFNRCCWCARSGPSLFSLPRSSSPGHSPKRFQLTGTVLSDWKSDERRF